MLKLLLDTLRDLLLSLDRRRIVHFKVTTHPTAEWTALQLYQAFPYDTAPRFLVRDRDGIYGDKVVAALEAMGIEQKVISARSPWQNGYCERAVGTLKRACLNHMIVFGEAHARRIGGKWSRRSVVLSSEGRWWAGCIAGITAKRPDAAGVVSMSCALRTVLPCRAGMLNLCGFPARISV